MKTKFNFNNLEKGQVIPILVVGLLVAIMMAALLIDGGMLMANRRTAQAAADAGALAGAQEFCMGDLDPVWVAEDYAKNKNGATDAIATLSGYEVTVVATVEHPSFFARIFGENSLIASAEAVAACVNPSSGKTVMPIAFYWESPPVNKNDSPDCVLDNTCGIVYWDLDELMETLIATPIQDQPLEKLYVIAESTKVCEKDDTGEVVCVEMKSGAEGGNRAWIELNELVDGNLNIKKIIQQGIDYPLYMPAWLNGKPGTDAAVFSDHYTDLGNIQGYNYPARLVFVPVFDKFCSTQPEIYCQDELDIDPGVNYDYLVNANQPSYRLRGMGGFVITCVTKSEKCEFGQCLPAGTGANTTDKDICPGFLATEPTNQEKNAIEGYFIGELSIDTFFGAEGVDVGMYLITLIK